MSHLDHIECPRREQVAHGPELRIAPDGTCRDCGQQLCIPRGPDLQLERDAVRSRAFRRRQARRTPGLLLPVPSSDDEADLWDELVIGRAGLLH